MDNTKMKKYLEDIMTLESEKYRLEEIKNNINSTINKIESEYRKNTNFKQQANIKMDNLLKEKEEKIKKCLIEFETKKNITDITIFIIVAIIIGVIIGLKSMILAMLLFPIGLVIGLTIISNIKISDEKLKKNYECKTAIMEIEKEYEKKEKELKDELKDEVAIMEKQHSSKKKEMMKFCDDNRLSIKKLDEEYNIVIEKLKEFYDLNVIFQKYRNLSAITMFYEYFSSSRVFELEGKDGAYNLYESELRQNLIINNLSKINNNLEQIKENQYCMYNEMKNVNASLQTINRNLIAGLNDIAKIEMANLAVNTEIAKNVKTIKRIQVYDYIMNK